MPQNIVEYALKIDTKTGVASLKAITKESKKTEDQFDGLSKQSKKTGQSMDDMAKDAAVSALALLELGKRALKAVGAIISLGQVQADLVNDLNDLSNRSGLAAESIQALQFAFEASGQSADQVKGIVDKMPRVMAELASGTGKATKAFKKLGLDARDAHGKMKPTDEVFKEVISSLQGITSQSEKASIATEIFGRQAGNMLQAFGQTQGLETFDKFVREFGIKTGKEASDAAAEFQQAVSMLDVVTKAFGQTILNIFGQDGLIKLIRFTGALIVDLGATIAGYAKAFKLMFDFILQKGTESFLDLKQRILIAAKDIGRIISFIPGIEIDTSGISSELDQVMKDMQEFEKTKIDFSDQIIIDAEGQAHKIDAIEKALNDAFVTGGKEAQKFKDLFDETIEELKRSLEEETILPGLDPVEVELKLIGEDELLSLLGEMEQVAGLDWEGFDPFANLAKVEEEGLSKMSKAFMVLADAIGGLSGDFTGLLNTVSDIAGKAVEAEKGGKVAEKLGGPEMKAAIAVVGALSSLGEIVQAKEEEVFQRSKEALEAKLAKDVEAGRITEEDAARIVAAQEGKMRADAADIVEKSDLAEQAIQQNMENQIKAIVMGLGLLPGILLKVLPKVLITFTKSIIKAIVMLPVNIGKAFIEAIAQLVKAIAEIFTRTDEEKAQAKKNRKKRQKERKEDISDWWERTWDFQSGGRIPFAQSGIRFTGSTGLALLHRNETVVPESGQASQAVQRDYMSQVGGQGMTININSAIVEGNAIDALVRQIEQRFRAFGSSTSPLFTGN